MTLSPAFLDELRARTTLSALIAPSVKLIRAGREYKACCPFHNEKTPSFTVNDEKGFYHCFGCGAHGDAIRFLTDHRGLPFIDAVKELAATAGMELPAPDPRERERAERAATLYDVMASAERWFCEQLQGIEGSAARDYLAGRGIDAETIARFRLGFAPDSRGRLKAALADQGEERLVEAGLLIRPDEGDRASYDRFRGRLMIPIRDARGRVIAFGGRILGPGEPKYLNSPETPLFDKGRTLFNIDRASPASRSAGRLVVVEGYMDVIALDRAGIAEVVAPNGTAVTEAQLERMWRLDPAPILCFDGDSAGRKAAVRAALRALPLLGPERTLRFVELPAGQDPDDLVRSGGAGALEALLAAPEPLVERLWRHEAGASPLDTPEARAGLRQRLLGHASAIGDGALAAFYRDAWRDRLDALFARPPRPAGDRRMGRTPFQPRVPATAGARAIGRGGIDRVMARAILQGFVRHPDMVAALAGPLAALPIAEPRLSALRDALLEAAYAGPLDRAVLDPILAANDAVALGQARPVARGFSFCRADADDERARRDLEAALDLLVAAGEIEAALAEATERLKAGDEQAFDEQRRLHAERERATDRLASLNASD